MKLSKAATIVSFVAMMDAFIAPAVKADDWNRKTVIMFSGPVEISQDEKPVYAAILATPNYRFEAAGQTVVTFGKRPAGEPEASCTLFYPRGNGGEEFVAWKARAIALAKETNTPVLFMPAEIPGEIAGPIQSADVPALARLKQAPIVAIRPTGEEIQLAGVVTAPPDQTSAASVETAVPATTQADRTLPGTASSLPLRALFGLPALGGAWALRMAERRVQ